MTADIKAGGCRQLNWDVYQCYGHRDVYRRAATAMSVVCSDQIQIVGRAKKRAIETARSIRETRERSKSDE